MMTKHDNYYTSASYAMVWIHCPDVLTSTLEHLSLVLKDSSKFAHKHRRDGVLIRKCHTNIINKNQIASCKIKTFRETNKLKCCTVSFNLVTDQTWCDHFCPETFCV